MSEKSSTFALGFDNPIFDLCISAICRVLTDVTSFLPYRVIYEV